MPIDRTLHIMAGRLTALMYAFVALFFGVVGCGIGVAFIDSRSWTDALALVLGVAMASIGGELAWGALTGRGFDRWWIARTALVIGSIGLLFVRIGAI